jgi:hypothetical protein
MIDIIERIDRELILNELNDETFVRRTNNGNKEIFIVDHYNAPNTLQEIGRLREVSFRDAGGGSGKAVDIDEYDLSEKPFKQLIVWDPDCLEIVGGYRFLEGNIIMESSFGYPDTPTAHLFNLSDDFKTNFFPKTFELGRSFVQPLYQPNYNLRKGIYSLDNLWDGLGELVVQHPEMKYFFGKITMYPSFNPIARDLIHFFLDFHFGDENKIVSPIENLGYKTNIEEFKGIFNGKDYIEDYKTLNHKVREFGENIPPLVNAYMNLSPTMKYFGTSINERFGNVEESGILITINDIYDSKIDRHVKNIIRERV